MELENKAAPGSSAFSHLNMALNAKKNKVAARQALPSHPCCQKERLDRRKYAKEQYLQRCTDQLALMCVRLKDMKYHYI